MSFILNALKKSETDRQRQSGPALFEVRVAPPRNGLPLWAVGLAVLLAVNLVIVAWVLLHRPAAPDTAAQAPASTPAATPLPPMTGSPTPTLAARAPPGAPQTQTLPSAANAVPASGTAPTTPLARTAGMTQPAQAAGAAPAGVPAQADGTNAAPTGGGNEAAAAQADAGEKLNPDDYAPAADPGPAAPFGHVTRATSSGVPLYQDAALAPGAHLPTLRLDLHVFAAKPQERFVMINMHKLREGDSLPEGVRVESITPEGAILSQDGTKFLLPRQ